jgi:hypothetical protein
MFSPVLWSILHIFSPVSWNILYLVMKAGVQYPTYSALCTGLSYIQTCFLENTRCVADCIEYLGKPVSLLRLEPSPHVSDQDLISTVTRSHTPSPPPRLSLFLLQLYKFSPSFFQVNKVGKSVFSDLQV